MAENKSDVKMSDNPLDDKLKEKPKAKAKRGGSGGGKKGKGSVRFEFRADDWKIISSVNMGKGVVVVEEARNVPPDRKGCLVRNVTDSGGVIVASASVFIPGVTVQKLKNSEGYALNGGSR